MLTQCLMKKIFFHLFALAEPPRHVVHDWQRAQVPSGLDEEELQYTSVFLTV